MFDRPAEILEITRKICPRGVQNRKSNKKRGGGRGAGKGSAAIKAIRSDWIIYRRRAIDAIAPTAFPGIREKSPRAGD